MNAEVVRVAFGYMESARFLDFLGGGIDGAAQTEPTGFLLAAALAFIGGLAMNLTPCVLPMIPVNVAIIGRKFSRGLLYAAGQAIACGVLGLAAALGGMAVGAVHASPIFNLTVAAVLVLLALGMFDVVTIDLSRFRGRMRFLAVFGVFGMGVVAALLAGACVAPALAALLTVTSQGVAAGDLKFAALPFVFGVGIGLPWPFAAAGIGFLPKPGVWMVWFKRVLGVAVLLLALMYGARAATGFSWKDTAAKVQAENIALDKDTLFIIGAPWCTYCHKMEDSTLKEPEVVKAMEQYNVRRLNVSSFDEIEAVPELAEVEIKGVPAYVIVRCKTEESN